MSKTKRYNEKAYSVITDYGHLRDDQTASGQICPACEGGSTKEGSFSVSRRGGVLVWNCHRASCGFRGRDGEATPRASSGGGRRDRSYPHVATSKLSTATAGFLATRFGIPRESFETAGLGWTGDSDSHYGRRICYPIFGPDSRKRGENYRSYEGRKPKAIIHLDEDAVAACWYKWKRASPILVVVEDQVSAIKVAPYYDTLALLGTSISDSKATEIIDGKYKYVYLCLDNDATYEAIKLQLEWRNKIPNMRVLSLDKDIKDYNKQEFEDFLRRLE